MFASEFVFSSFLFFSSFCFPKEEFVFNQLYTLTSNTVVDTELLYDNIRIIQTFSCHDHSHDQLVIDSELS